MAQKLHYFNLNVIAESIRYILYYSGEQFEDIRYGRDEWPIKEVKDRLPFGVMPFYEEGDRSLDQSLAIARYLGSKYDLLPSDPWDQAALDAAALNIYDFFNTVRAWYMEADPEKKTALKKAVLEEHIEYYFSRFENVLNKNNGHFGEKLSWADFILIGIVEITNGALEVEIEKKYPTVEALIQEIRNLPGVKEYIATRTPYRFN